MTPEDVRTKEFTTVRLREGYDLDEVDAFLDEVEAELSRRDREVEEMRSQPRPAAPQQSQDESRAPVQPPVPAQAQPAPAPQPTPQAAPEPREAPSASASRILELAQRTADQAVAEARQRADSLIAEAETRAREADRVTREKQAATIGNLERERNELAARIEDLRSFEREYRARLASYLQTQLKTLDEGAPAAPGAVPGLGGSDGAHSRS